MLCVAGMNKKGSYNGAALHHHSDHYSDASLAFFLCRRLISPSMAVTINCALLSSGSLTCSIASTTSCGTRAVINCDFEFLLPVATNELQCIGCVSVYTKESMKKNLKCVSLQSKVIHTLVVLRYENSEAQKDGNPCWASNHNVSEAYTMAYLHSTQTRPEKTYQWRFLALNRSDMSAKFCRVSLEAPTEHDARMVLAPFFILSFAGRLPVQEVANV